MLDIALPNLITAFGIALAAGLFTVLGSGLVMFSKTPNPRVLSFGLAFAGGAMVYVSLTEIFNKSSEAFGQVYDKDKAFAAATLAFLAGMGSIALIDFGRGFGLHHAQAVFIAFRVRCSVWRDCGRDGVSCVGRIAARRQALFRRTRNRLRVDVRHGGDCTEFGVVSFLI